MSLPGYFAIPGAGDGSLRLPRLVAVPGKNPAPPNTWGRCRNDNEYGEGNSTQLELHCMWQEISPWDSCPRGGRRQLEAAWPGGGAGLTRELIFLYSFEVEPESRIEKRSEVDHPQEKMRTVAIFVKIHGRDRRGSGGGRGDPAGTLHDREKFPARTGNDVPGQRPSQPNAGSVAQYHHHPDRRPGVRGHWNPRRWRCPT